MHQPYQIIIDNHKTQIEEEKRKEEEKQRIDNEIEEVRDFAYNIPVCLFPSDKFVQLLKHLQDLEEETIDMLLASIQPNIRTFETDALNKWLKIVCEVVRHKGTGIQLGKVLWNELTYTIELNGSKIKYLSLTDYFAVFGISDFSRVLSLMSQPIDEGTSEFLNSISVRDANFEYYVPLIILNRYFREKGHIPERIARFFSHNQKEIWCLISAQQGTSFGYDKMNLKQIANLVWNSYPQIAGLFLYLIRRNGFIDSVADVKIKPGEKTVNHYQRLIECVERKIQTQDLTNEDFEILFPMKKNRLTL